jgi:Rps23 Pro-64 3,4-dihydroxylase Tpa1-like proline 4-hydroxylase
MYSTFKFDYKFYKKHKYIVIDKFLNNDFAILCQNEILKCDQSCWDRYANPFEQKCTYRDKNSMPPSINLLMNKLNSSDFIKKLNKLTGFELIKDESKHWWGIHTFKNNDKLDIHVDAGRHPENNLKKIITLGIYLSYNWKKENGGNIEFWSGDNASNNNAKIYDKIISIEPTFNKLLIFECNDYSWHGAPIPCKCNNDEIRIFVTCSYLTDIDDSQFKNNRKKAFFVKLPDEPDNPKKDKLRLLRADSEKYKQIYKTKV